MSPMNEKDNALVERGEERVRAVHAFTDILRLRWRLQIRENIIGRLVAENERLRNGATCPHVRGNVTQHCSLNFTLTDEEREAIGNMIHLIECQHEDYGKEAHTLRNLLARLS